jgi:DtxR family Mn-dependent transcriptional regulator
MPVIAKTLLAELKAGDTCSVAAVKDTSTLFLQYLEKLQITIGTKIKIIEVIDFDGSLYVGIVGGEPRSVSMKFAESLFVQKLL